MRKKKPTFSLESRKKNPFFNTKIWPLSERKPYASIFGNMLQFGTKVWDIFATQFECSHLALDEIAFGLRPKEIFLIFQNS